MSTDLSLPVLPTGLDSFADSLESLITKQLSPNTRQAYQQDAKQFRCWLSSQKLTLQTLTKSDCEQYRRYLADSFAKTSASHKLVVARKLLQEAVNRNLLATNPALNVPGYNNEDQQETPYVALDNKQGKLLLKMVDTTTAQGKRDLAILLLLLRTGLRRSECAALRLGDLLQEQGHYIAVIRHAKGDKRRKVKIPVDVMRTIEDYLSAVGRDRNQQSGLTTPVFVQFRRGDHPQLQAISPQVIERIVKGYAHKAGLTLTPHGLRATFVTLALEGGAKLHQVQYAVGHADPRTTERYQARKLNLDDNAVDFVRVTRD